MGLVGALLSFLLLAQACVGIVITVSWFLVVLGFDFVRQNGEGSLDRHFVELAKQYPAPGIHADTLGLKAEIGLFQLSITAEALSIAFSIGSFMISHCSEGPVTMWRRPMFQFQGAVLKLLAFGSIWSKCTFYGLFCWRGSSPMRWQDVLPHILSFLGRGEASGGPPYG